MGNFQGQTTADPKEHKGPSHICQKHLDDPQDLWENILEAKVSSND